MPTVRKVAMFIHGYGASYKMWEKSSLTTILQSYGYETDYMITLPGAFLDHKKGFDYYAKHIAMLVENKVSGIDSNNVCCTCGTEFPTTPVQTNPPADEIILICHSMGGVAARLYLSDLSIGNPIAKAKVKTLITLATPHHGTDVLLEEIVSGLLAGLGPLIIPTIAAFIPGFATGLVPLATPFASLSSNIYPIAISAASKGKCYKEIQRNTKKYQLY